MQCKLCLNEVDKFVKSHIVPRSFYGIFARKPMKALGGSHPKTFECGVYGRFLCKNCESRFSTIDDWACKYLKQRKCQIETIDASADTSYKCLFFSLTYEDKKSLAKFTSSLLWRAKASGIEIYKELRLGCHEVRIRKALLGHVFDENLENRFELMVRLLLTSSALGQCFTLVI